MSKHFQQLLKALKTSDEVKALGFNKEEIKSLASDMDKNLEIKDDASEEEVESVIDEAVDKAIPFLKMAQKASSRIIKKSLSKKGDEDDDEEEDDEQQDADDLEDKQPAKKSKPQTRQPKSDDDDEVKTLLKAILKKQEDHEKELSSLRNGNLTDKRRSRLEKLLKDTGTFGKRTLRQFDRMTFADEDEFEDFLDDIKDDLEETNQERANAGLAKLGTVPDIGGKTEEKDKPKVLTDKELDKLAESF